MAPTLIRIFCLAAPLAVDAFKARVAATPAPLRMVSRGPHSAALQQAAASEAALPSAEAEVKPTPELEKALTTDGIFSKINKISTFASILCAIDCTVFPLLLALFPLLNLAGSSAAAHAWLHRVSHAAALWFVAPVGGAAVLTNFLQHRRPTLAAWGISGLLCVLLANTHLHMLPHAIEHLLHEYHSIVNVVGCALLLSSQFFSQRLLRRMGKCCGHDHSHDHAH
eukprot:6176994-Pleurochrysis_carterae.AAC.1